MIKFGNGRVNVGSGLSVYCGICLLKFQIGILEQLHGEQSYSAWMENSTTFKGLSTVIKNGEGKVQ